MDANGAVIYDCATNMRKVNISNMEELSWASPKGNFTGFGKEVSEALGRIPSSMNLMERHPFDVEICRVPAGKTPCPYHSHSTQWEYYQVLSGNGVVRDAEGETPIEAGDTFIFKPGEPHQILNPSAQDLVLLVVADNPVGDTCHYPDSNKWSVALPERGIIHGSRAEYYDGEE